MLDFLNPCSGKRWRILPTGLIEVEGEGIPTGTVKPGSRSYQYMENTWRNWGGALNQAASRAGVPVSWLLAIATMETGYLAADPEKQAHAVSPVGARGVMQIMPTTGKGFGVENPDELFDPRVNIRVAGELVSKLNQKPERGGLPGVSALYNSGRLCTTDAGRNEWMLLADANYPRRVIEWNNAALENGLVLPFGKATFAIFGAAAGVSVALVALGVKAGRG